MWTTGSIKVIIVIRMALLMGGAVDQLLSSVLETYLSFQQLLFWSFEFISIHCCDSYPWDFDEWHCACARLVHCVVECVQGFLWNTGLHQMGVLKTLEVCHFSLFFLLSSFPFLLFFTLFLSIKISGFYFFSSYTHELRRN